MDSLYSHLSGFADDFKLLLLSKLQRLDLLQKDVDPYWYIPLHLMSTPYITVMAQTQSYPW